MDVQIVELAGQKLAIMPLSEFERLTAENEDRDDERAADAADQRRLAGEEYLPIEFLDRILAGESALKVWRKHRGMTLDALATASGTSKSMLSKIENGTGHGKPLLWRALAEALGVTVDDILLEQTP